jgi:DNA invertase Pin-like site-specific DNA recombinase
MSKAHGYGRFSTDEQIETTDDLGYSYIRFSSPEQQKGDSLRRQTEATEAWCKRNGVRLDTSLTLRDLGKSAFRGSHRDDKAALGAFLRAINQGKVKKGSYLVLENLDRLSREQEVPACHLLTSILMAGVKVVQLFPGEMILTEQSNGWELMRAVMELSRGHGESEVKSKRNGAAWEKRRRLAREGKDILTHQLPAWIERVDGVLQLIPAKAAAVHRVFELAAQGMGAGLIVKAMIAEKLPGLGSSGLWSRAYISLLLKDRRALGEIQPRFRNGKPAGDPIVGYFPAVVSQSEWDAARAGCRGRKQPRGRVGEHVNVFAGLLKNAREGDTYYMGARSNNGKHRRVLIAAKAMENGSPVYGFDFDVFERAVLSQLKEIPPAEILGDAPGQNEITALSIELGNVRAQNENIATEMIVNPKLKALVKAAEALDAKEKQLTEKLDDLRRQAGHSNGESWGEAMSLVDALEAAPDPKEARLKLRMLLRQHVTEIRILVVPKSPTRRLAWVQVFFASGVRRDYLIYCQAAGNHRPASVKVESKPDLTAPLDLRRRGDALKLKARLAAVTVETLAPTMRDLPALKEGGAEL